MKQKKSANRSISTARVYFLLLLILGFGLAVVFRLYILQVSAHDKYHDLADSQHKAQKKILPARGEIFLKEKDGEELFPAAVNLKMKTLFAIPREIENPDELSRRISEALDLDREEVFGRLSKKDDWYEVLKRKLEPHEVEKLQDIVNEKKGIYFEEEDWRYYPGKSLAAQTIGFVGFSGDEFRGQYGIERQFENEMRGRSGFLQQERDTFGRWISVGARKELPAEDGADLVLSLDHVLQFKAETALRNAVKRHGADGGKIVIVEPYSGRVLAIAAEPSFDPNEYSKAEDISVFLNPVISSEYECGSVFKPVTMTAGLDSGKVEPDTTYFDMGQVVEAGYVIKNSEEKSYGEQTMTGVIENSINTGVIFVEKLVGNENFLRYVQNFGFGQATGADFPGEAVGNISNLKTNRDIEFFTAAFGQGITVTPIQLTMAYAAMANGGDLMKPLLVDYRINNQDEKEYLFPKKRRTVISRESANKITLMLESNVVNGHGKLAAVPGYRVAGKTGTAQIADREKGGYLEDATVGTFAGYGPVSNPMFAMVVIIDYPKDVEWAESTAAPVFGEMAKFMFEYYGVEPTEKYTAQDMEVFARKHNYLEEEEEGDEEESDGEEVE